MLEKLVHYQIKYSKILLFIFILFTLFAANIAKDLKIDPDFTVLIPSESEYNTNDKLLKNTFEINNAVVILINKDRSSIIEPTIKDMSDPRITQYVNELENVLIQSSYVRYLSPIEVSEDGEYARVVMSLVVPEKVGSFKDVVVELDELINEVGEPAGINTRLAGMPMILDKIPTLLIEDNLRTILITLVFIFLILFWYSRDIIYTLVTMGTPVVSLIFLAALMVTLNLSVTITLAAVGVFILGLGADYGIHISTHYSRARLDHESHELALKHTIKQLSLPITASFITTLAGFAALILGVSPSSQAQGIVLAIGITVIFLTTFILFPILITVFAQKINPRPNYIFRKILEGLGKLAAYQTKYSKKILWGIGILTLVMIYGASQVQFSTSNSNWIPDDDPVSSAFRELNSAYGKSDTITIVLISQKEDLRNSQVLRDINKIKTLIESLPNVDSVTSAFDNLEYDDVKIHDKLTNTNLKNQFNEDFTLTTLTINSQNLNQGDDGKSVVLKEVRKIIETYPIYNTDISLYGDVVRFDELSDSLQRDAGITTVVGLALVFFVATSIYVSLNVGLLALVPIIIAVIWAVGLMGFFKVPFTSLSTGIVSLVLGVGVDFSIHLVDSIKKYTNRFNDIKKAIEMSLATSGKAIFLSSLTTFIGFSALTFAKLLGTQRLGWSLAFAILSVFIVTMTLVPAVMNLLYKRELNKKKKNG